MAATSGPTTGPAAAAPPLPSGSGGLLGVLQATCVRVKDVDRIALHNELLRLQVGACGVGWAGGGARACACEGRGPYRPAQRITEAAGGCVRGGVGWGGGGTGGRGQVVLVLVLDWVGLSGEAVARA